MSVFNSEQYDDHEQVVFCKNASAGFEAIIAIHDTTLGPAFGGVRLWPYATEADALRDALRLSRAMTLKAALAGLDLGGGKAVIFGDRPTRTEPMLRAFGRFVESLGGRFIVGEGLGTAVKDMNYIRRETRWVVGAGLTAEWEVAPPRTTAWGVYHGIRACLEVVFGSPSVAGRVVAIQGMGRVGMFLARFLHEAGARLKFADVNQRRLKMAMEEFGGEVLDVEAFFSTDCDVLVPCAVGGILNEHTIPQIRAPIVGGGANDQLWSDPDDCERLRARGLVYAPDFVINAGGLMYVHAHLEGQPPELAMQHAENIFNSVKRVLDRAHTEGITTVEAANRLARERIDAVAGLRGMYLRGR